MRTGFGVLLLVPVTALAGSTFDGTWRTRLESFTVSGKPDVYLLADGLYTCSSCVPVLKVEADGQEHTVSGTPYFDTVSVRIVSPTTVLAIYKAHGEEAWRESDTVAPDGKSLVATVTDHTGTRERSITVHEGRVSAAPPGAHAVSGAWRQSPGLKANDTYATVHLQLRGDRLRMQYNGTSYDAPLDGTPVPLSGDPGHITVSLRRIDANTILETNRRDGKVTEWLRMAAAPDGETISVLDQDLEHGQTITFTLDKDRGVFFSHRGCPRCDSLWAGNSRQTETTNNGN
jgi:hypothetical protein